MNVNPMPAEGLAAQNTSDLPLDIYVAVKRCASRIISTEAVCLEWGASAATSCELAEKEIAELLQRVLFSRGWSCDQSLESRYLLCVDIGVGICADFSLVVACCMGRGNGYRIRLDLGAGGAPMTCETPIGTQRIELEQIHKSLLVWCEVLVADGKWEKIRFVTIAGNPASDEAIQNARAILHNRRRFH